MSSNPFNIPAAELEKRQLARRKELLINIVTAAIVGLAVTYIPNIVKQQWDRVAIGLSLVGVGFIIRTLAVRNRVNLATHLIFLLFNAVVFIYAGLHGRNADTQLHFITITLGAAFIFNYGQKRFLAFHVLLPLVLWIVLELAGFKAFDINFYSPEDQVINSYINQSVFVVMLLLFAFFIIRQQNSFHEQYFDFRNEIVKKNTRLNEAVKELDRINYTLSHDLRSPIASAKGLLSLIEVESESKERERLVALLKQNLFQTDEYLEDILFLARNKGYMPKNEEILIKPFIQTLLDLNHDFTKANKIAVELKIDNNVRIATDEKLLRPILQNLISNAIKYSDASKEKSRIIIKTEVRDEEQVITVYDNGVGIEKDSLQKIFNQFQQLSANRSGFGLGLYLVSEFAKVLGVSIEVDSELGEYSIFSIHFPKTKKAVSDYAELPLV